MKELAENIREQVLDILLSHKGFENFWYDLDDSVVDEIIDELDETIEGALNEQ
jgi:hypothetical protein